MAKSPRAKHTIEGKWTKIGAVASVAGVAVAVVLAFASYYHWWPFTSSPSPTPTTALGTTSPGPTQTAAATSPGTASTALAFWMGPVGITFSGIDFDSNTPGPGFYVISWERYVYQITAYGTNIIVSRYAGPASSPTEAECRTWALSHNSQLVSGVNRGDRLCFISQDGRTVRFIVTNITSDAVEGQATVWNDGNQ
jgi:hypothetical protein